MKLIVAFVQPFMLDKVVNALLQIHEFPGLSITHARGFGQERALAAEHTVGEQLQEYVDKLRLEILALGEIADEIVEVIATHAHTGNRGDGKILVVEVLEAVRIRTGERGHAAVAPSSA